MWKRGNRQFNISITSWLFCVYMNLTKFSWGLYKTSVIESNLKSNLSVVFILMFCWVSTTAAVTTVLPMKRSKRKSTLLTIFMKPCRCATVICQMYSLLFRQKRNMHTNNKGKQILTTGGSSRSLWVFVWHRIRRHCSDGWKSWRWDSIWLFWEILTQNSQNHCHVRLTQDQLCWKKKINLV